MTETKKTSGGMVKEVPEWYIECSACGWDHHIDMQGGHCVNCGSFLPKATFEQEKAFTEWYVNNAEEFIETNNE